MRSCTFEQLIYMTPQFYEMESQCDKFEDDCECSYGSGYYDALGPCATTQAPSSNGGLQTKIKSRIINRACLNSFQTAKRPQELENRGWNNSRFQAKV